jgi:cyclopropane fatty-acyl-phospholipid synthase-like methyltransferase
MGQMTTQARTLVGEHSFDASYYQYYCGKLPYGRSEEWLALFRRFAERIDTDIGPRKVLDAGCAMGLLVEALRNRGIEAYGVDLSSYAIGQIVDPIRPFCWQGSLIDPLTDSYDLIVTIEVLEHMPIRDAEAAIANICAHTSDVLFSSTPSNYKESTHVNVHPTHYWVEQFARHGFLRDVDFDSGFITPWAIRFRKRGEPAHRVARDYERRYWEIAAERDELREQNMLLQQQLTDLATRVTTLGRARKVAGRFKRALLGRTGG